MSNAAFNDLIRQGITIESGDFDTLGDLTDITDSSSDTASLSSVHPSIHTQHSFLSSRESPPPSYISEDGDSHDMPDISDYSGKTCLFLFA